MQNPLTWANTRLRRRRYDVAVESIAVPSGPVEGLLFTAPYAHRPVQVFTSRGGQQIADVDDLAGQRVGVLAGSPAEAFLKGSTQAKVRVFSKADKAYRQLLNGNLQFLVLDSGIAVKAINGGVPLESSGMPIAFEDLAFVVKADEADLAALLNYAIAKMHERVGGRDSALTTISMKWFNGVDLTVKPR